MSDTETSGVEQCGNVTTVVASAGPGGLSMPVRPKCVKPEGHDGPHTNGSYTWGNVTESTEVEHGEDSA